MTTQESSFGAQLRRLRLAAGLTQERLAERAGVSAKAIIALENDPARTPRLETVTRLADALSLDRDARAGLLAASRSGMPATRGSDPTQPIPIESPTPSWRGEVARAMPSSAQQPRSLAEQVAQLEPTRRPVPASPAPRRQDWGEAPDVGELHGRAAELDTLGRWIGADGCRLVAIVGMGGIGKTALTARVARELASQFDAVYWRSLRNAPPCPDWLAGAILFLSEQQSLPVEHAEERLRQLLALLRARRSLLVLDNLETILQPGAPDIGYRMGYEGYGQLLQWLGEAGHQSCLLVTSREVPPEVRPSTGAEAPVRVLRLGGLDTMAGRALLADRGLVGDAAAWEALVTRYGGNALALQLVSDTIGAVFGAQIAVLLDQEEAVFGDIRRLLDGQFARLSAGERAVLDRLAIEREPVAFGTLAADLGPGLPRGSALEALEGLRRRSLLERGEQGATVTLQPVALEHATERLVERMAGEIARGEPARLVSHAVIKARAREHVRRSQERLIGEPILAWLSGHYDRGGTEQRLLALLKGWRGRPTAAQGYGPGNVANLLRLLRGHLRGLDLSNLELRQAYLAVPAEDARLAGVHLDNAVIAEAMSVLVSTAISPDGAYVAAGTLEGTLRLWRIADRRVIFVVEHHPGPVWSVALDMDGQRVVTGAGDGTVRVWDAANGECLRSLAGHTAGVRSVALSVEGGRVASGGPDGTVRLWDLATGECLHVLASHTGEVWGVALSADGTLIASGGFDGTARVWDAASGACVRILAGHTEAVLSIAMSADGRRVATGGADTTVRVWDAASGECLQILAGHAAGTRGVALSANGQRAASCGLDGTVRLWDAATGELLRTLVGHTGEARAVALSADARRLASGGSDGTARLWDAGTGACLDVLAGHAPAAWSMVLSGNGRLVATVALDGTRVWDAATGWLLRTFPGHTGEVRGLALSGDGRLVASGGADATVRVWDTATGACLRVLAGDAAVVSLALSADGRLAAAGGADAAAWIWDTTTGERLRVLSGHPGTVWRVALSGDGRLAATTTHHGTVRLWDTSTGACLHAVTGDTAILSLALSGDGRRLAGGGANATVRFWDTRDGACLRILAGHTGEVRGVALSADGRWLASGGLDGTVRVWDTATGECRHVLFGHSAVVWSVALSGDGDILAGSGLDGTVCLWDAQSGALLRTLRPMRLYEQMDVSGLTGVTAAQRADLLALGAVDRDAPAPGV